MGTDETAHDIELARQLFDTQVIEPDPHGPETRSKIGTVNATKKGTDVPAGSLSFGVSEDEQDNVVVRTTQFDTEVGFEGQHVALLLAYTLREHYGVDALHFSGMEPTPGGTGVLASLRRRGIMVAAQVRD